MKYWELLSNSKQVIQALVLKVTGLSKGHEENFEIGCSR